MKNIHVSDLDIQIFLFDQLECEPQIAKHIISCEECKRRVKVYQSLAIDIKNQPEPKLDFNIDEVILDQLPSTKKVSFNYNYLGYFITLILAALTLTTILLFRETLLLIINDSMLYQNYFIISIVVFVFFHLVLNAINSYNEKINLLNY